jgi:hypothetical protein
MQQHGESWLYIDREIVHFWDYFVDRNSALTNTELLFTAAARPHADFFLPHISHVVFEDPLATARCLDPDWKHALENMTGKSKTASDLHAQTSRIDPARTIIVTSRDHRLTDERFKQARVIEIDGKEALLNLEPAWRQLRFKLNKELFDTVLVNLGPVRAIILPRLAQVYGVRALDASPWSVRHVKKPHLARRIHRKIKGLLAGH